MTVGSAAHEGTGLSREQIIAAYKQLDLGVICVVDHDTQNFNLLKVQPFSSFPSSSRRWKPSSAFPLLPL